jgi:hypothetical protein
LYTWKKLMSGGLVLAGVLVATAVPAGAATPAPESLAAARRVATARIDARLKTLAVLKSAVGAATHLTSAHRSTLDGLLASDTSGLTALRGKVAGETTVAAVRADERSMVVDYRVYLLVVPKVRLTIASDVETSALGTLTNVHNVLSAEIAAARAKGTDVGTEQAELTDLSNQQAAAGTAIAGRADALLALSPGPDGSAITSAVTPIRQAVRTARKDIAKASADAKKIKAQLS